MRAMISAASGQASLRAARRARASRGSSGTGSPQARGAGQVVAAAVAAAVQVQLAPLVLGRSSYRVAGGALVAVDALLRGARQPVAADARGGVGVRPRPAVGRVFLASAAHRSLPPESRSPYFASRTTQYGVRSL